MTTHVNTKAYDDLVWRHYQECIVCSGDFNEVYEDMQELVSEDMWIADNELFQHICSCLKEGTWF